MVKAKKKTPLKEAGGWGPKSVTKKTPVRARLTSGSAKKAKSAKTPAKRTPKRTPGSTGGGKRKPRRFRPGMKALKEIRKLQTSVDLLIPKAPFVRLVRELASAPGDEDLRWRGEALEALQEAAEAYLVSLFEDSLLCCLHSKRVTLFATDMRLSLRLRGETM